jgi:hypothetical protein
MGMIESALVAVFAWFALNFLATPFLAVREKRLVDRFHETNQIERVEQHTRTSS